MTADISSSVAENAECWCEGRKNRKSLVMGRRFTPATPSFVTGERGVNFLQSLPEPSAHESGYRSNQTRWFLY
jgi:hypothetical protein